MKLHTSRSCDFNKQRLPSLPSLFPQNRRAVCVGWRSWMCFPAGRWKGNDAHLFLRSSRFLQVREWCFIWVCTFIVRNFYLSCNLFSLSLPHPLTTYPPSLPLSLSPFSQSVCGDILYSCTCLLSHNFFSLMWSTKIKQNFNLYHLFLLILSQVFFFQLLSWHFNS